MKKYTIGIDYGTDSVRALIVDCSNGSEISSAVIDYPRWKAGKYCDAAKNRFRQHPFDYIESLEKSVKEALSKAPSNTAANVVGISVDNTKTTNLFVEFLLRFYRPYFIAQAPETARANINLETLRPLQVPFPPLELQEKFSELIRKTDFLLEKYQTCAIEINREFNVLSQRAFS